MAERRLEWKIQPVRMKGITIIGGGLAGLSLGICLRRRGATVTIHETGVYPRHRVCGEFISGRGIETLRRLGLLELLEQSGACWATSATLFSGTQVVRSRPLLNPALCISRFELDSMLAGEFLKLGGDLRCRSRWVQRFDAEGIVRASGRRVTHDHRTGHWFGLKAHAKRVNLQGDLEMHFSDEGYVGLCQLPREEVNVCGLFRRERIDAKMPAFLPDVFLRHGGGALRERLLSAVWNEDSICSVAGLPFRDFVRRYRDECSVGDSLGVIPPVTGNGMSIAFESAELATPPIFEYAAGHRDWRQTCEIVQSANESSFGPLIRRAGWLHATIFQPAARRTLMMMVNNCDWLWRLFFAATR